VYLHRARWLEHGEASSTLEVTVRGGFYVRSLARDLGRALGTGAHLSALERVAIGPWRTPAGPPEPVPGPASLPWLPRLALSDGQWAEVRQGRLPALDASAAEGPAWALPEGFPVPDALALGHLGRLVAVAERGAVTVFPGGL
jgi:tRNA pseudouridine55 synthase